MLEKGLAAFGKIFQTFFSSFMYMNRFSSFILRLILCESQRFVHSSLTMINKEERGMTKRAKSGPRAKDKMKRANYFKSSFLFIHLWSLFHRCPVLIFLSSSPPGSSARKTLRIASTFLLTRFALNILSKVDEKSTLNSIT